MASILRRNLKELEPTTATGTGQDRLRTRRGSKQREPRTNTSEKVLFACFVSFCECTYQLRKGFALNVPSGFESQKAPKSRKSAWRCKSFRSLKFSSDATDVLHFATVTPVIDELPVT